MLEVKLICIGKLKEKYWRDAVQEYAKRLSAFCRFQIIELNEARLPQDPNAAEIAKALGEESKAILAAAGRSALYTLSTLTTQIDRTGYPNPSELRDVVDLAFTEYVAENSDEAIALWDEEIPILNLCYVKNVYAYKEGLKGAEELDFSGMIHPGACSWE